MTTQNGATWYAASMNDQPGRPMWFKTPDEAKPWTSLPPAAMACS